MVGSLLLKKIWRAGIIILSVTALVVVARLISLCRYYIKKWYGSAKQPDPNPMVVSQYKDPLGEAMGRNLLHLYKCTKKIRKMQLVQLLKDENLVARHVWVVAPLLALVVLDAKLWKRLVVEVIPYNSVRTMSSLLMVLQSRTQSGLLMSLSSMVIGRQKQIMVTTSLSASLASNWSLASLAFCSSVM